MTETDKKPVRNGILLYLALFVLVGSTALNGLWETLAYRHTAHPDTLAQLAWMHRWSNPEALPGDINSDYFQTFHVPPGLRAVYYLLIQFCGFSILGAAKSISVVCFLYTAALLYLIGRNVGQTFLSASGVGQTFLSASGVGQTFLSASGGLLTLTIGCALAASERTVAYSPFMMYHTGLARGFMVPILLTVLLGLMERGQAGMPAPRRIWISSAGLLAGVLFYPPGFVVGCISVGLNGLLQGSARSVIRYYLGHLPVAVAAMAVVADFYPPLNSERFGHLFTMAEASQMPEFHAIAAEPLPGVPMLVSEDVLSGAAIPWLKWCWPLLLLMCGLALIRSSLFAPLHIMVSASLICTFLSILIWFRLYEPSRYWMYPFFAFFTPAAGALCSWVLERVVPEPSRLAVAAVAAMAVALINISLFAERIRIPYAATAPPASIVDVLKSQPADTLIAFYPGDGDWVSVETVRPILISPIALFPYHSKFHPEAIERFIAVRDAVYATDLAPLRNLRDKYHVRYLIYAPSRFEPGNFVPSLTQYPGVFHLEHLTRNLLHNGPEQPFVLKSPPAAAVVAAEGDSVLLDLNLLPP